MRKPANTRVGVASILLCVIAGQAYGQAPGTCKETLFLEGRTPQAYRNYQLCGAKATWYDRMEMFGFLTATAPGSITGDVTNMQRSGVNLLIRFGMPPIEAADFIYDAFADGLRRGGCKKVRDENGTVKCYR